MGFRGGLRPLVTLVLVCLCASCLCSLSDAKRTPRPTTPTAKKPPPPASSQQSPAAAAAAASYPALPVRAVCLGGWLVTEGWILPSLFDGIPNKDLLVRSVSEPSFSSVSLHADLRTSIRRPSWSSYPMYMQDGTQVQFKSALRKTYLTADQGGGGAVVANRTQASDWETFKVRPSPTTLPLEFQLRCVVSRHYCLINA